MKSHIYLLPPRPIPFSFVISSDQEDSIIVELETNYLYSLSLLCQIIPASHFSPFQLLQHILPLLRVKSLQIPALICINSLIIPFSFSSHHHTDYQFLFCTLFPFLNELRYCPIIVSLSTRTLISWYLAMPRIERKKIFVSLMSIVRSSTFLQTSLVVQVFFGIYSCVNILKCQFIYNDTVYYHFLTSIPQYFMPVFSLICVTSTFLSTYFLPTDNLGGHGSIMPIHIFNSLSFSFSLTKI